MCINYCQPSDVHILNDLWTLSALDKETDLRYIDRRDKKDRLASKISCCKQFACNKNRLIADLCRHQNKPHLKTFVRFWIKLLPAHKFRLHGQGDIKKLDDPKCHQLKINSNISTLSILEVILLRKIHKFAYSNWL